MELLVIHSIPHPARGGQGGESLLVGDGAFDVPKRFNTKSCGKTESTPAGVLVLGGVLTKRCLILLLADTRSFAKNLAAPFL